MIPHTRSSFLFRSSSGAYVLKRLFLLLSPPESAKARFLRTPAVGDRSTELSANESSDRSTEIGRSGDGRRFCEDPHNRFGTGGPDQHTTLVCELAVQAGDLVPQGGGKLLCA